jgi:hypothetical protein
MTQTEREVFIDIEPGIRIRFRRSQAPPPVSYAITLECEVEGAWMTVRLWDNADGIHEHHEHEYTRTDGKQKPSMLEFATANDAMSAAIRKAKREAEVIVRQWRTS